MLELPTLLPPDDLLLQRNDGGEPVPIENCRLLAHNVAPDGKANPIEHDDPYFIYVYQHADAFFRVRGLNPEMMSGEQIPTQEADRLLVTLPYRTS